MDDASHFLPLYLRFVKGVVDSNDLPLNVSREILQDHPLVHSIKTALTKRVINSLRKLKKDDRNQFTEFWSRMEIASANSVLQQLEDVSLTTPAEV